MVNSCSDPTRFASGVSAFGRVLKDCKGRGAFATSWRRAHEKHERKGG